jgi:hypothetical protein
MATKSGGKWGISTELVVLLSNIQMVAKSGGVIIKSIVKAAQREGLGDWKAHAKVRGRAERCNAAAACSGVNN